MEKEKKKERREGQMEKEKEGMVNEDEREFLRKLEQMKKGDNVIGKLKDYENLIKLAVMKKHPIRHIQKALKEVMKIKVSEYTLKRFITKELNLELAKKTPKTTSTPSPSQKTIIQS